MKNILNIGLFLFIVSSCRNDKAYPDFGNYPEKVGLIIHKNCISSGCHNSASKEGAGGLNLETWNTLFEGDNNGLSVIPYRPDFSSLSFFINTYTDLGTTLKPTMPLNKSVLSRDEVKTINNWILAGAPDRNGKIKFSDNVNRKKYYITNQGCDVVTVMDAETGLPMRYITVGNNNGIESPHMIKVSPDGKYWYVIFIGNNILQKYSCADDSFVDEVDFLSFNGVTSGNWNTFSITKDSKYAYCVDWSADGQIVYIDLDNMTVLQAYTGSGLLAEPHGSAIHPTMPLLYVSAQKGNFVYRIDISDPYNPTIDKVSLDGNPPSSTSSLDIHEIAISPDGTKYYATCQKTNEVRVVDVNTDQLLFTIPVGQYPQELCFSLNKNYLFVSCPEDLSTGKRGVVSIINYQTNTFVKNIHTGWQPHGIAVDDSKNLVIVANQNVNSAGPAPHHSNGCGGRNGYVTFIDLNSLDLIKKKNIEVSVQPYSISVRK